MINRLMASRHAPSRNHKTESLAYGPGISVNLKRSAHLWLAACQSSLAPSNNGRERAPLLRLLPPRPSKDSFWSDHETPMSQKIPAPIVLRLKAWREANNLSQAEAVAALVSAGVPAKLQTLQQWESGRRSPPAITTAALERFLHEHPSIDRRLFRSLDLASFIHTPNPARESSEKRRTKKLWVKSKGFAERQLRVTRRGRLSSAYQRTV